MAVIKLSNEKSERFINVDHIVEIEKYTAEAGAVYYYLKTTRGETKLTPADAKKLLADLGISMN